MIHKINITNKPLPEDLTLSFKEIKHMFLYDSLYKDIKCANKNNIEYFKFFDTINAHATRYSTNKELENDKQKSYSTDYFGYYFETILEDEKISQILRGSSTLIINEKNCFENKNMKIVFAERGFIFCKKAEDKDMKDTFERVLFMFLLAQAYNKYSESSINKVAETFSNDDYDKMIQIRDGIFSFDVRCFFHNPIKIDRHETFNLWNIIAANYYVKMKYDEMKSQISDLANIIEVKQEKLKEEKNKRFEKMVAIIGIILAATSLVSFYQDIKELLF